MRGGWASIGTKVDVYRHASSNSRRSPVSLGYDPTETPLLEYGRTSPDALAASGFDPRDVETAERWRRSPHYRMLQTGETFWRRRLNGSTEDDFSVLPEWRAEGMTDYIAIITRFAPEGVIGEMDGVYSAWATRDPEGFTDDQIAALKRASCLTWDLPLN
jgi:hypothetical protein